MAFHRRWLYKWVGSALKALIVENREDFDLLKSNGYLSTNKKPEQILERKKQKEKAEKEDWLDVFKDSISGKTFRGNDLSGKKNELEKLALEKLDIDLIMQSNWPGDAELIILDEIHKYKKWKSLVKGELSMASVIRATSTKQPGLIRISARL